MQIEIFLCLYKSLQICFSQDAVFINPTHRQASRAANIIYAMLLYRRELEREELNPVIILPSYQYINIEWQIFYSFTDLQIFQFL